MDRAAGRLFARASARLVARRGAGCLRPAAGSSAAAPVQRRWCSEAPAGDAVRKGYTEVKGNQIVAHLPVLTNDAGQVVYMLPAPLFAGENYWDQVQAVVGSEADKLLIGQPMGRLASVQGPSMGVAMPNFDHLKDAEHLHPDRVLSLPMLLRGADDAVAEEAKKAVLEALAATEAKTVAVLYEVMLFDDVVKHLLANGYTQFTAHEISFATGDRKTSPMVAALMHPELSRRLYGQPFLQLVKTSALLSFALCSLIILFQYFTASSRPPPPPQQQQQYYAPQQAQGYPPQSYGGPQGYQPSPPPMFMQGGPALGAPQGYGGYSGYGGYGGPQAPGGPAYPSGYGGQPPPQWGPPATSS